MKKLIPLLTVGAALFLAATPARAVEFTPAFATSRAGGFVDLWPAKDFFMTIFGADLQFRVARRVFLDISFTGAYVDYDAAPFQVKHATYGNPQFGVHYAGQVTPNFDFFVGGIATLPILQDPDLDYGAVAALASPIRGYYDADRLVLGHFALRGMFGFEWHAARRFYLRAEVRPVVYIATRDNYAAFGFAGTPGNTGFAIEHAVEGEYRLDSGLGFGLRLQAVATLTEGDALQAVAEPFLMLTPRIRGLYLRLGTPVALDENLGFGLERDKLATVRFSIGGQW
jgi:hypothetical protein